MGGETKEDRQKTHPALNEPISAPSTATAEEGAPPPSVRGPIAASRDSAPVGNDALRLRKPAPVSEAEGFLLHQIKTIREMFDSNHYLAQVPDLRGQIDPVRHYLTEGWTAGFDPTPAFSTVAYLQANPDVQKAGMNPFFHYLAVGRQEGRRIRLLDTRLSEQSPQPIPRGQRANSVDAGPVPTQHGSAMVFTAENSAALIAESGLLDSDWYIKMYPDIAKAGINPVTHYSEVGWKERRRPNPYFDPDYYRLSCPTLGDQQNPLLHYITDGEARGLRPIPFFDPAWYRETYALSPGQSPLRHYLLNLPARRNNPNAFFDIEYYLSKNPDIRAAGIDPVLHYFETGYKERREHSTKFDGKYYRNKYLGGRTDECPLLHFLLNQHRQELHPRMPESEGVWSRELKYFTRPAPTFETHRPLPRSATRRAKILAFYLPQFHAFAENDAWWGDGFTEWTNIARGAPRFKGHYQPRIPRDLGFYNLLSPEVLRRQIQLALDSGVFGFVYYYYWFNGRRLMERPLNLMLDDATLEMPFCLMWANENWTRRWDGFDNDVLIKQDYSPDDDEALVDDFLRHFRDRRYIRVNDRPLLMIYRPGLIPEAARTLKRWRELFHSRGQEQPILVMSQGFGDADPGQYGMDAAIEFPPHKTCQGQENIHADLVMIDPDFDGYVISYSEAIARSVREPMPGFPLIKTACPSWDNDARRQGSGMVLHGSTPALYQRWLEQLVDISRRNPFIGQNFVAVNAWNEWAEGAYLEPDVHFGSAYLNATARAVSGRMPAAVGKIVFVGHDAHAHGAQLLLLHMVNQCIRSFGMDVRVILLEGGKLLKEYEALCPTHLALTPAELATLLGAAYADGWRYTLTNSAAASRAVPCADLAGMRTTLLIHELPGLISEKQLLPDLLVAAERVGHIVFPADFVRDRILNIAPGLPVEKVLVSPQGCYKEISATEQSRTQARTDLGIGASEIVVLGVGYADFRKGFDLFVSSWRASRRSGRRVHFVWVGNIEPTIHNYLKPELDLAAATGTFHRIDFQGDMSPWYAAADIHLLSSREDPFPTVAIEALQAGVPSIAFAQTGGIAEMIVDNDAGKVVPVGDVVAVAGAIDSLTELIQAGGDTYKQRLQHVAETKFNFPRYVSSLLSLSGLGYIRISVIVPSYNYGRYLAGRLGSIFGQSYPVFEVIVLDDCSTDDSSTVIERCGTDWKRQIKVVRNARNSGSVFHQWRRGVEMAQGDYVWIAEADDDADPGFLEALALAALQRNDVQLSYCDSRAVDADGNELSADYKFYYREVEPDTFDRDNIFGTQEFLTKYLSERNIILNVSCCLWRRQALVTGLERAGASLFGYRLAGDWYLYVLALGLNEGSVAYVALPLNVHRRHASSVTHNMTPDKHLREITRVHKLIRSLTTSPDLASRQAQYVQHVATQLGLT